MFSKIKNSQKTQQKSKGNKHGKTSANAEARGKSKPKRDHGIKEKKPSSILTTPRTIMLPRLLLITSVIFLCVMGLAFVYSASSVKGYVEQDGDAMFFLVRQIGFMFVSLVIAAAVVFIKYTTFNRKYVSLFCWIFCALGLLLVLVAGVTALGAERAIFIGPFAVQPAEFTKITLMLFLSHLISEVRANNISRKQFVIWGLVAIFSTLILVPRLPDLVTLMIISVGILVLLVLGGFPLGLIFIIIGCAVFLFIFICVIQPYHLDRINAVINPYSDPDGDGYQLIHSLYAFGTGGIFGTGLGTSRQKYLYLPEAHTDFIFAIIGEEAGLLGAFLVLAAFVLLVYAGLRIAYNAPDRFGCLVAGSLTSIIGFQACVNMACVVGLAPITGKPLPFISYGGSSLMSSMIMVALIFSVSLNSSPEKRFESKRDKFVIFSRNVNKQTTEGAAAVADKASTQAVKVSNKVMDAVGNIHIFSKKQNSTKNKGAGPKLSQNNSFDAQKRNLSPEQKGRISYNRDRELNKTTRQSSYKSYGKTSRMYKTPRSHHPQKSNTRSSTSSYADIGDYNMYTNNSQSKTRSNALRRKSTTSRSGKNRR